MEIVLKGDKKKVEKFLKTQSLYMKRKGFEVKKEAKKDQELTAAQVIEQLNKCTTLEELKQFESNKKQQVVSAYKKKLKEFE